MQVPQQRHGARGDVVTVYDTKGQVTLTRPGLQASKTRIAA